MNELYKIFTVRLNKILQYFGVVFAFLNTYIFYANENMNLRLYYLTSSLIFYQMLDKYVKITMALK